MEQFIENIPMYLSLITMLVTIASVITSLTPSKADDKILNFIVRILNVLAINVGKNKNADAYVNNDSAQNQGDK